MTAVRSNRTILITMNTLTGKIIPTVVVSLALASTSCMTTYDANGRPVQSVDPGAAAVGAAAAGVLGYAIGQNNDDRKNYYYGGGYRRGYGHGHGHRRHYGRRHRH